MNRKSSKQNNYKSVEREGEEFEAKWLEAKSKKVAPSVAVAIETEPTPLAQQTEARPKGAAATTFVSTEAMDSVFGTDWRDEVKTGEPSKEHAAVWKVIWELKRVERRIERRAMAKRIALYAGVIIALFVISILWFMYSNSYLMRFISILFLGIMLSVVTIAALEEFRD